MAKSLAASPDVAADEGRLLERLLTLYRQEHRLYQRVLELSREQGAVVRRDGELREITAILDQKRECLDSINQLEKADGGARSLWERGRQQWSSTAQARLHQVLQEIGAVIEAILLCEEENDHLLLKKTRLSG
jgi:hypothetical protein